MRTKPEGLFSKVSSEEEINENFGSGCSPNLRNSIKSYRTTKAAQKKEVLPGCSPSLGKSEDNLQ